jgi:hypothetical protein
MTVIYRDVLVILKKQCRECREGSKAQKDTIIREVFIC